MPVTADIVESIIERERPEGIILSMGGQTGLNCGVALEKRGTLKKFNVRVLGTQVDAIEATEDRGIFSDKLNEINERIAPSFAVTTVKDALAAAEKIGYPCMIRAAFALGGLGSGLMNNKEELTQMARTALASAPQLLVEKSLKGWKEVEYEVVRDAADNCITVCNMENFDPLGVHTGDSIVIAPSQTLTDEEYHMLRDTAIKVVRHLKIVGECNIQYALDPKSNDYCIIEVNPRLSRSSALASKATGYPLAAVAAKLALGQLLPDLTNSVTQSTTACFEPSLDYIVVKVPRWDLSKFDKVSRQIGSAMKSVGEVMAIGRTFEESLQKALRMTDPAIEGFEPNEFVAETEAELVQSLEVASDTRIYAVAEALKRGWTVDRIQGYTAIDPWFLWKLKRVTDMRAILKEYSAKTLPAATLLQAKKSGFSDKQLGSLLGSPELDVRALRKSMGITPFVKQIDTMAAEFPAATNYLYITYNGDEHDVAFDEHGTMVIGSGVYRIGSSVEFDWCSVSAIRTLRQLGKKSVMINYNPETVSTDFDECDRLYFEELSLERVLDVYELEGCENAIVSVGGQIPNTLALKMGNTGVNVAGTSPKMIDTAEDRNKFSALCDSVGIDQPAWQLLASKEEALAFCERVGYPCLVRPSYVLSGAAMNVAYSAGELTGYLTEATKVSKEHPVVVSKFIENAREIDVDAVAKDGKVLLKAISEHVENAGVHSGDASLMLPPQTLDPADIAKVELITDKLAAALQITGPFNMQLIAKDGEVKVIECNLRASRSCPFSSKVLGVNFIELATKAMVGAEIEPMDVKPSTNYVGVKVPMFSFQRLKGADPALGVEMASTGEVACFGPNRYDAFLKAMLSTGMKLPTKNILVSMQERFFADAVPAVRKLQALGYTIFATEKTSAYLSTQGVDSTLLHYKETGREPCIDEYIQNRDIELVLMFSNQFSQNILTNYAIRRLAVDYGVPLITNVQVCFGSACIPPPLSSPLWTRWHSSPLSPHSKPTGIPCPLVFSSCTMSLVAELAASSACLAPPSCTRPPPCILQVAELLADSLEANKIDISSPASLAGVSLDVRNLHEWYACEKKH
jgi:carbamoyl-phosphate synthase large subunit